MDISIHPNLSPFNVPIDDFLRTRFENDRLELTAIMIFGDYSYAISPTHTQLKPEVEKPEGFHGMTILGAVEYGLKEKAHLTMSHVLAFLGSNSSDGVQRLFFLVKVEETQSSVEEIPSSSEPTLSVGENPLREGSQDDSAEVFDIVSWEKEELEQLIDTKSCFTADTDGLLSALRRAFAVIPFLSS
jgi:hypothetical protein